MDVRLTEDQFCLLFQWGVAHGLHSVEESARLLLAMLLELQGEPAASQVQARGTYLPKGWDGVRVYRRSVKIRPFTRYAGTRALWSWGLQRGQKSISGSFRDLVDVLAATWNPSASTESNLVAFSEAVGLHPQHMTHAA